MVDILTNEVVCPHCNEKFYHNKVNGIALIELTQQIDARKRMYCRLTLDDVEKVLGSDTQEFRAVKKFILDGYNDLSRSVQTVLGFGTEVE